MSMKNSSDIIGNRTRDLPACSAVPQPSSLPHVPTSATMLRKFWLFLRYHQRQNSSLYVPICHPWMAVYKLHIYIYLVVTQIKGTQVFCKIRYQTGCKVVWFPFCQSPRHHSDFAPSSGASEQHWDQLAEALPAPYICSGLIDRSSVICSRNSWSSLKRLSAPQTLATRVPQKIKNHVPYQKNCHAFGRTTKEWYAVDIWKFKVQNQFHIHTHTNQFHVHTHTHKSISCTHTHKSISCTHT